MDVLFLKVGDLRDSEYIREGTRNLLKSRFGLCDTIALSGRIDDVKNTRYGPRFWINDGEVIQVTVGTFNGNVRRDAEKILGKFKPGGKKLFILVYGNPYETDQLYINVNNDNGVILIDEKVYEEFHELRKQSRKYLTQKTTASPAPKERESSPEEVSSSMVMEFIKERDVGEEIKVSEIFQHFNKTPKKVLEEKMSELMEMGELYEPKPRLLKVIK